MYRSDLRAAFVLRWLRWFRIEAAACGTCRAHARRSFRPRPRRDAVAMTRVAVVGAGLSGLVAARRLKSLADVTVFEKSRGPGGRMATRYAGEFEFDHGTQYFTARSEAFRAFLRPLIDSGDVTEWRAEVAEFDRSGIIARLAPGHGGPRYVGVPGMNRIGKALSTGLNVAVLTSVTRLGRSRDGWTVIDDAGVAYGPYDWLVLAAPAAQSAALAKDFPDLVEFCGARRMRGCFALMLGFAEPIELAWRAAVVRNMDVSWIAVNSSKPGRKSPFTLVVHSSNNWADAHIHEGLEAVRGHLLDEAASVTGIDLRQAMHQQLHRWRYANIARQAGPEYFLDEDSRLAACGDWCTHGRVEGAFTSASQLADSLAEKIQPGRLDGRT